MSDLQVRKTRLRGYVSPKRKSLDSALDVDYFPNILLLLPMFSHTNDDFWFY